TWPPAWADHHRWGDHRVYGRTRHSSPLALERGCMEAPAEKAAMTKDVGEQCAYMFDHMNRSRNGMERDRLLIETTWLAEHLHDPDLRLVDIRGYVKLNVQDGIQEATYVGAREDYDGGHIPGAVYIDWTKDIVNPDDPVEVQIAPPERFATAM